MARHAEGWKVDLLPGKTVYRVRFTQGARRYERSTGEVDEARARTAAAQIYADVVSGRRTGAIGVSSDLKSAFAQFLVDYTLSTPSNAENAKSYVAAQFIPFFGGFDRLTKVSFSDYIRQRLQKVSRSTIRKELSALRMFREWCAEHGVVFDEVPSVPKRGHPGTRAKNARRRTATILRPEEIARILLAMPERSRRTGAFLRPFFTVLWETALRPYSTVIKLEAPIHYQRGSSELFISREIEKAKYERRIPLSEAAREALDRVCPPQHGKLFPINCEKNMDDSLTAACRLAGIEVPFSIYDFRHSRISYLANSGAPLAGVARLVGHLHVSTTALYVQANNEAARDALKVADRRDGRRRSKKEANSR